ncbi:MAG: Uncharacterised protein [Porticoccaceae bacterium UBA1117]|jgi:hypothetical protein|nr:MAG: Uncharacterised protein [Porticoccaceae bacterium UBA1117]
MGKLTKTKMVMQHLRGGKTITSLEAINLYSATRLSGIIFCLRNKGHNIVTIPITILDKYGNNCHYAKYKLLDVELVEGDKPLSQQWDDNTHKFLVDARETANKNFSNLLQDELKETNDKNFFKRLWERITE